MCHIYQKLSITDIQNCLNWCLMRDMVGQVNVAFSWSFLKPILQRTYLVAQITVEQTSLNLADEINSLKLKNFKFRGNSSIFVRTERLNTIVRKFARVAKSKLQNKFQLIQLKARMIELIHQKSKITQPPLTRSEHVRKILKLAHN